MSTEELLAESAFRIAGAVEGISQQLQQLDQSLMLIGGTLDQISSRLQESEI